MALQKALFQQFINTVQTGTTLLDDEQQLEIENFVRLRQHSSGGFEDRGGRPDLYYSVFGFWLASALGMTDELSRLRGYLSTLNAQELGNGVHRFSLLLLQQTVLAKKRSAFQLLRMLLMRDFPVNMTYQVFLVLLVVDSAHGQKKWVRRLGRLLLSVYRLPKLAPCSMAAALLVAKSNLGMTTARLEKRVLGFFQRGQGFVAFEQMHEADLLSTGVALFALQKAGADLRLLAPDCLGFLQQNYSSGAFMSGTGDRERDLEYTFYGLLTLGSLAGVLNTPQP
ncbi:prenyltransferase/squalene oxidase repeat-containing protein [Mangrovibacterium sp.]|uniref:prenyltransferase/squalene oxidase repeat-containing protein n=1 Tax=Mangrovibacterium sp. TaxID=1961364 RepID=UPI003563B28D